MAAPSGTVWGGIVNSGTAKAARLGIYTSVANTSSTVATVSVSVYVWTRYRVTDSTNTTYFNWNTTSASTAVASNVSVSTTNTEWSTSNQILLYSTSTTYSRGKSATSYNCAGKIAGLDYIGTAVSSSASFSIPAKPSYTVSYNANGGSGAPGAQTKWYGETLKLSTATPTRTGYTFQGWATSASGSVSYAAGGNYTSNAAATLYAVWKANTYAVTYDANGGTGAPAGQTKTYGTDLTLSSTVPTRTNHNFLGWGTSASSSVSYEPGSKYTGNAAITLYAIWELAYVVPTIEGLTVTRSSSTGSADEYGAYAKVGFSWETCQLVGSNPVSSIKIEWKTQAASSYSNSKTVSASGASGTVSQVVGGSFSTDTVYSIRVTVTDSKGGSWSATQSLLTSTFTIDLLAGGKGVAFGKAASKENTAEFEFDIEANGASTFNDHAQFKGGYGGGYDESGLMTTLNEVGGGRMHTDSSSAAGIIKIVLPQDFGGQMISFDVEVFSYTSKTVATYTFAGQIAKNASTGVYKWSNPTYNVQGTDVGTSNLANQSISFGRHSNKVAVSIGEAATVWGICSVTVRNVKVWYNNFQTTADWADGWQIVVDANTLTETNNTYTTPGALHLATLGAADYIVEHGRSGNWTWKKWASGDMEVWGKQTPTVTGTTNSFSIAMPVTFANTEYMVNMIPGHNGSIVTKYGDYNANGNMEHGYGYFVFAFTVSSKYNVTWNFIIKGRWKS